MVLCSYVCSEAGVMVLGRRKNVSRCRQGFSKLDTTIGQENSSAEFIIT